MPLAAGLISTQKAVVVGYDVRIADPQVRQRAVDAGVTVAEDLADVAANADVIFCLTHASGAVAVASAIAPHLHPQHIYSDWNSGGPQLKKDVAGVIEATGAGFVDGAVMAAVPPKRHQVPTLLSGGAAAELSRRCAGLDMDLEVVGDEPGEASALKMLRSLLVKGLEALLLECLLAARVFNAESKVLTSMNGTLPMHDWNELASYLTTRTYAHTRRRAQELGQVVSTLREAGVEPLVASGAEQRLTWMADLELPHDGSDPQDYAGVIDRILEKP